MGDLATVMAVHEVSLKKMLDGYSPVVRKGQVVELENDDGDRISLQLVVPEASGYLDAHPEGADRGGYVPMVFLGRQWTYWDSEDGSWR